jgi:hypothetical protein
MMRLRRASAIAALCVLASAAMAHAECAWVLWVTGAANTASGPGVDSSPWASYESLQECKTALQGAAMKKIVAENERKGLSLFPVCLPDTVDPRGPKGK